MKYLIVVLVLAFCLSEEINLKNKILNKKKLIMLIKMRNK